MRLSDASLRIGHMFEHGNSDDEVEGATRERQVVAVDNCFHSFTESDIGMDDFTSRRGIVGPPRSEHEDLRVWFDYHDVSYGIGDAEVFDRGADLAQVVARAAGKAANAQCWVGFGPVGSALIAVAGEVFGLGKDGRFFDDENGNAAADDRIGAAATRADQSLVAQCEMASIPWANEAVCKVVWGQGHLRAVFGL
jgi:hypothetical protein